MSMPRRAAGLALTTIMLTAMPGLPRSATADPVVSSDRDRARVHFKRGKAHQDLGEFDEAIAEYQVAYEIAPMPELVFNIAQCYRFKGDRPRAIEHYRRYVAANPNGKGAKEARAHVVELQRQIDEEAAEAERKRREAEAEEVARKQRDAAAEADRARIAAERAQLESERLEAEWDRRRAREEAVERAAAAARAAAAKDHAAEARRRSKLRIVGLVSMGAGLGLGAVATYYGLHARSLHDQVESAPVWTEELDAIYTEGQQAERTALVLGIVAGGALVGGGITYWLGWREPAHAESESVSIVPMLGPAVAGVVASGRF